MFRIFIGSIAEKFLHPLRRLMQPSVIELLIYESKHEAKKFMYDHISTSMIFHKRFDLYRYIFLNKLNSNYTYFEFGVSSGHSINFISNLNKNNICYGFDSFSGLEEDWTGTGIPRGYFFRNRLPKVNINVILFQTRFQNLNNEHKDLLHTDESIKVINIDCDTYTATKVVLDFISSALKPGDIILLDDFMGFPGYHLHQFKAWNEFIAETNVNFKYIAFSNNQCAIEIF